jgi:hypothetical protein
MKREIDPTVKFDDGVPCGRIQNGATADDYRLAVAMSPTTDAARSLMAEWGNKPHRLIYDLAGEVKHLEALLAIVNTIVHDKCVACHRPIYNGENAIGEDGDYHTICLVRHLEKQIREHSCLPTCPFCGAVGEATAKWEEEKVPYLADTSDTNAIQFAIVRVPVWTCNIATCELSWTDYTAEDLRQKAVEQVRGTSIF